MVTPEGCTEAYQEKVESVGDDVIKFEYLELFCSNIDYEGKSSKRKSATLMDSMSRNRIVSVHTLRRAWWDKFVSG